jgi:hypothetical protein
MARTLRLTPEEELEFQQFQQTDFWRNQSEAKAADLFSGEPSALAEETTVLRPNQWELTRGLVLHDLPKRSRMSWTYTCNASRSSTSIGLISSSLFLVRSSAHSLRFLSSIGCIVTLHPDGAVTPE